MNEHWWASERVITMRDVCELHPRKVHPSTVQRWCKRGLKKNGTRVRLESWKEGGERFTTTEAYHRFVSAQNE